MKEIEVRPFKEIIFRGAHPKEVKEEVTKQEVPLIFYVAHSLLSISLYLFSHYRQIKNEVNNSAQYLRRNL